MGLFQAVGNIQSLQLYLRGESPQDLNHSRTERQEFAERNLNVTDDKEMRGEMLSAECLLAK